MSDFASTPINLFEIDQPVCVNNYGIGACGASIGDTGEHKCYNTYGTCQDRAAYDDTDSVLTIKFGIPSRDLPVAEHYIIPSVKKVSTTPTKINPGGRAGGESPIGIRSTATISLVDHPHSDLLVDPYLDDRAHSPLETGTFWAKWIKRNPFNNGYKCRVVEGFAGQSIEEMQSREYMIDRVNGPDSSGNVTIKCVDILRKADKRKALVPSVTTGELSTAISQSAVSLVLTGANIDQYSSYGTNAIRINDEVIRYASLVVNGSGNLEFSGLSRGSDNTQAAAHDAGDTAQACLHYVSQTPWGVTHDLLVNFAGIDGDYINFTSWSDECSVWLSGMTVTRLITEPVGVDGLIGELCEQCGFYIWYDEISRSIEIKAIRPPDSSVPLLTDDRNLIKNSVQVKTKPELRCSEVWVSYGQKTPISDTGKRSSYKSTLARIVDDNPYNERVVYDIFSPWLESQAQADLLAFRVLSRYTAPPKYVTFSLHIKDRELLSVGDPFDILSQSFVDNLGFPEVRRFQVISMHEAPAGERINIQGQEFEYDVGHRVSHWMVDAAPVYTLASDLERETGMFWADDDGRMSDGDTGYVWS